MKKLLLLLVLLTACEQPPEKYVLQSKPMVILSKNHYTNSDNQEIFEIQTFDGDETYYCEIQYQLFIVLQKKDTIKNYFIKIK